ncbi:MAG TPA: hypothetical protein VM935_20170 [Chitinophagaceae bacterium]|nr:hypothetical protein [Chitinophagaceae bacterium]
MGIYFNPDFGQLRHINATMVLVVISLCKTYGFSGTSFLKRMHYHNKTGTLSLQKSIFEYRRYDGIPGGERIISTPGFL